MSYDISIGPIYKTEHISLNFTSNLSKFFRDFISVEHYKYDFELKEDHQISGLRCLNGLKGSQVVIVLKDTFEKIDRVEVEDSQSIGDVLRFKYDPDNKWGDVVGAILFLNQLMIHAFENSEALFEITS